MSNFSENDPRKTQYLSAVIVKTPNLLVMVLVCNLRLVQVMVLVMVKVISLLLLGIIQSPVQVMVLVMVRVILLLLYLMQFPDANTTSLLACQDEKMQTLRHFWLAKMRKCKHYVTFGLPR